MDRLQRAFEIGRHPLEHRFTQSESTGDLVIERLVFSNSRGENIRGALTRPKGKGPFPGLLYIHAHGNRHDIGMAELMQGRPALLGPLGPEFAKAGYATLMIEMPGFGTRSRPDEGSRAKAALWQGRSLAGQMLGEQRAAFNWLAGREDVIAGRIGAFGISMGATLAYWLAAAEPRIACVAHLCCYADLGALIETGAHDLHGIYLTVPGLLKTASNGQIAGRVAPRPQLIAVGDADPLTPPGAVDLALAETRAAYAAAMANDLLHLHREPQSGHAETPEMRAAVMAFLRRYL